MKSSLWTIDIANLCAIKNLKHQMYTLTIGVQEAYATEDFYTKDKKFNLEKERVNNLFKTRSELGINVELKTIKLSSICEEILKNNVCIVLVDASQLNGINLDNDLDDTELNKKYTLFNEPEGIESNCCFGFGSLNSLINISKHDYFVA